eukprot:GEMP01027776.1.p1 GENE.GEMP01027776.1~~GEMP01027776.1.p1  ORF type:complete len:534 (+),score=87.18 GEMP01027776.1:403-2004(+)
MKGFIATYKSCTCASDDCSGRGSRGGVCADCGSTKLEEVRIHCSGIPVDYLRSNHDADVPRCEHAETNANQSITVNTQEPMVHATTAYAGCHSTIDAGVQSEGADDLLLLRELNRKLAEKLDLIAWQKRCADEQITILRRQKNAVEEQLVILSRQKKDVEEQLHIAGEQIETQSAHIGAQGVLVKELQSRLWDKHGIPRSETVNPVTPPERPPQQYKVSQSTLKWLNDDNIAGNEELPRRSHSQHSHSGHSHSAEEDGMAGSPHTSPPRMKKPVTISISQRMSKDSDGAWDSGDSNPQPQCTKSNSWLAYDGPEDGVATLRLRGLPYRAKVSDVMAFLGVYCQFLAPEDAITLAMNRDGRPSGLALVRMQAAAARRAQKELDRKMLGSRYVEVFGPLPYHRYRQQNLPTTGQQVANEIRAIIQMKGAVLMSKLGASLSDQSKQYLKYTGLGLKSIVEVHPEFKFIGEKRSEHVTLAWEEQSLFTHAPQYSLHEWECPSHAYDDGGWNKAIDAERHEEYYSLASQAFPQKLALV